MSAADWIIIAVIVFSVATAAIEGFFQEAFSIAGLVIGYLLAAWQYHRVAAWLDAYVKSPWLGDIAGFVLIFVAVLIVAGIVGRVVRWAVRRVGLTAIDRFFGGLLGLVRGCLTVAVLLMAMAAFTPTSAWLRGSELAPYFLVVGRAAIWVAPSDMRARFFQGLDILHQSNQDQDRATGAP